MFSRQCSFPTRRSSDLSCTFPPWWREAARLVVDCLLSIPLHSLAILSSSFKHCTHPLRSGSSSFRGNYRDKLILGLQCISSVSLVLYSLKTASKCQNFKPKLGFEPVFELNIIPPDTKICSVDSALSLHDALPIYPAHFHPGGEKQPDLLWTVSCQFHCIRWLF